MQFELFSFSLTLLQIAIFYLVALLIGMSKTGIHGTGMLAVPLLAIVFGGMGSSGILLPILCLADIFGVVYYHRHASWNHLKKLFPSATVGILLGTFTGSYIDDTAFKFIMAIVIFLSVILMFWLERRDSEIIPHNKLFAHLTGSIGGFTSMVGNLAGAVMAVYFLSMRLPKNVFIGTTAWFFLVINIFKVPFHVFYWKTITVDSFLLDVSSLPVIALGAYLGIVLVKRMTERIFRWFILGMTMTAAIMMIMQNYS